MVCKEQDKRYYTAGMGETSVVIYLVCIKGDRDVKETFGCLQSLYNFEEVTFDDFSDIFDEISTIVNVYLNDGFSDMLFRASGKYFVLRLIF